MVLSKLGFWGLEGLLHPYTKPFYKLASDQRNGGGLKGRGPVLYILPTFSGKLSLNGDQRIPPFKNNFLSILVNARLKTRVKKKKPCRGLGVLDGYDPK